MIQATLHRKNIILHLLQKDKPSHPRILLQHRSIFINILKNIRIIEQDLSDPKLGNNANRAPLSILSPLFLNPLLVLIKPLQ